MSRPTSSSRGPKASRQRILLALGSLVAIGLLSTSVVFGAGTAIKTRPPYLSSHPLTGLWANNTTAAGSFTISTNPSANSTSGRVAFSVATNQTGGGDRSIVAIAGFELPAHVAATRVHNVTANWSLDWKISGSSKFCIFHCVYFGFATAHAWIYLIVRDRTNNTSSKIGFGFISRFFTTTTVVYMSGLTRQNLSLALNMVHGHSYQITTYVYASIAAFTSKGSPYSSTVSLNLASPYGGVLNFISLR